MHTMRARAMIVAVALATVAVAMVGTSAAATPGSSVQPAAYTMCTWTVNGPTYVYADISFTSHRIKGKHTGDPVTSPNICGVEIWRGFVQVNVSSGGVGYMYVGKLMHPRPSLRTRARYLVTGSVNVRTAPSTTLGKIIKVKHRGDVVTSPTNRGLGFSYGFAPVNLGNGELGWISSAFLQYP